MEGKWALSWKGSGHGRELARHWHGREVGRKEEWALSTFL